jgi:hypothetical protein
MKLVINGADVEFDGRAQCSSRTSLISTASLVTRRTVMSLTLDPRSPKPYTLVAAAIAGSTPRRPGTPSPGRQRTVGSLPLPSSADVGC